MRDDTWLLAGIWSGSRFFDLSLKLMGFGGEGKQNTSVVVVKQHVTQCPTFANGVCPWLGSIARPIAEHAAQRFHRDSVATLGMLLVSCMS